VIVRVGGRPVRTLGDLRRLMAKRRPGEVARFTVRRSRELVPVTVRTVSAPEQPDRAIVGIVVEQAADIDLPFPVRIDSGSIGGPSAGLAFALDLMEELGRDVDRGHRVAATGELDLEGHVSSVGALKQKTIGARRANVDVFLVPAGDNAREARRHAQGLRVVPVQSFRQALRVLATLPREP
jgi:PDZ domain-containing protein